MSICVIHENDGLATHQKVDILEVVVAILLVARRRRCGWFGLCHRVGDEGYGWDE